MTDQGRTQRGGCLHGDWAENPSEPDSTDSTTDKKSKFSRRGFIGAASASAGVAAIATVGAPLAYAERRRDGRDGRDGRGGSEGSEGSSNNDSTRFTRIFEDLPAFAEPSEELTAALTELSKPGGILDANDPLEVGPIRLITEPELSPNNLDNPNQTAGTTFIGQFLDHDITNDGGSNLGRVTSIRRSTNLRTPRFDLDSVYGGGPFDSPELYNDESNRFLVESGGQFEDLPRDANGQAIIADPRNDENMMLSGIQVAFLLFHNAVAERVEATGVTGQDAFERARRIVRWHWQWTIVHEYLPQIVGQEMVDDVMTNGPQFFNPNQPQIPVEFQTAAFRFGHSQVRPSYRANLAGQDGEPFFAMVFDADQLAGPDPETLLGGYRAPRRFIGWQTFFDFGDGEVKPNKRTDTTMSTPLFRLPSSTIALARGEQLGPTSLATRNLLRHITWELPSGQSVANAMGVEQLSPDDLSDFESFGQNLGSSTPLWLYTLRESDVVEDGAHLGPVGGRIVAEVFANLLAQDETSYLGADPSWTPDLPSATQGDFRMTDLLTLAGVDPTSRGQ